MKHNPPFGAEVTEIITGFKGLVDGHAYYADGINRALVVPKAAADGSMRESQWINVRLLDWNPEAPTIDAYGQRD